jgi:hypothetical protein
MFPMTSEDPFAQPSASRQVVDPESGNAAYSFDGKPDRWKRYRLPDPETGAATGYTRSTTFAKSISDTFTERGEPAEGGRGSRHADDLYAAACALDFSDRETMNRVANQAKEKAGAKTSARSAPPSTPSPRPWTGASDLAHPAEVPPARRRVDDAAAEVQPGGHRDREAGAAHRLVGRWHPGPDGALHEGHHADRRQGQERTHTHLRRR